MDAMRSLGPTRSVMGGVDPPDWTEILSFAEATGQITRQFELEALSEMCASFIRGLETGQSTLGIEPKLKHHKKLKATEWILRV